MKALASGFALSGLPRSAFQTSAAFADAYLGDVKAALRGTRRQWCVAIPVGAPHAEQALAPQVALAANGHAMAVWQQWDGVRFAVWACVCLPGLGWSRARCIGAHAGGDATYPQVAMDAVGNATVVWQQADGVRVGIWASSYTGGSWSRARPVDAGNGWSAFGPSVAVDGAGDVLAVWEQSDGAYLSIWTNRCAADGSWGTARRLEASTVGNALFPSVKANAAGDAIAVWQQPQGAALTVWACRYTPSGGWTAASAIAAHCDGVATAVQAAIDPRGNATALWKQSGDTFVSIWAKRYAVGEGWSQAELLVDGHASGAGDPCIAMDATGSAIALWEQWDSTRGASTLWAQRCTALEGWGPAVQLDTRQADSVFSPRVALDGQGNALAVWQQWDGAHRNIWAAHYTPDEGWGGAELMDAGSADSPVGPELAINATGAALAVWGQSDGERIGIWARAFR